MDLHRLVDRHYGGVDLRARILDRLREGGRDLRALTRDDLAEFDELHTGGRPSTRALATLAGLRPGARVLDVGSGVGGPARTIAAEFGCAVVGIDLTDEFCRAAVMLTGLVGLSDRVVFVRGTAIALPFRTGAFDAAWSQNAIMNVDDKAAVFREVRRVLAPGGVFALEVALAGPVAAPHYPTFWASSPAFSFLVTPAELRAHLAAAGWREAVWDDTTAEVLARSRARRDAAAGGDAPPLGRSVVIVEDLEAKIENGFRNLDEGRVVTARLVLRANR
ncbi:MAG: SAM-dependent methyltransferase [Betaproteobacteria bacterium]